ncbi:hypothetical protein AYO44_14225 [Planctomycetaceae bacterium SCGC AG-212-F19]|nr:hypothetical protein AYO44_14225 [Planctomycetaceae bacterium SCGC AG-212-F19]
MTFEDAFFMLICWAMFPTLIIVAVVVKLWEVYKARRWPATEGKVLVSDIQAQIKTPGSPGYNFHDTEVTNEPRVEYEYQVGGKTYRNQRITIGEKTSEYELEEILARYPVGAAVTVYYDPANPQTAVLERDIFNGKMFAALGCMMLFFIGVPFVAVFFYNNGVGWLEAHTARPKNAPFVAAAAGFGLLVLLFAIGYTGIVIQSMRWPIAPGRIISSGVQEYQVTDEGTTSTHYKVSVVYAYEVNGRKYTGDRLRMGIVISGTLTALAKRTARRYPVGDEVEVYYNPKKPSESVLHPYTNWIVLPWLMAAAMLWLAWAVATGRI